MKLKNLTITELKAMSYTDIAYMILVDEKKTINTADLFRKICDLFGYSEEEYAEKIGDFYTSLTTDCRFLFLDTAEWDLRDNHIVKMEVEDDEDEEVVEEDEEKEETDEEDEEENIDEVINEDLDDVDDDLEDLSIVEEEELEEN